MGKSLVYFVSDVHLGLRTKDPKEREERFIAFLKGLPVQDTAALYLLGDIWDFWYEYHDVVPKEGARVVSQLIRLMDEGVEVRFCPGNHDIWTFSFFESLGMKRFEQPFRISISGKDFCVGHGDALGGARLGYRIMLGIFHSKVAQALFSTLHPYLAYRFGLGWSKSNRRTHLPYHFRGEEEPLYHFAEKAGKDSHVDYFVFGHFHDSVDMPVSSGGRLVVLKDWMDGGMPCAVFDGEQMRICR